MRLLQIVSGPADAELVADRLWQAGARAVEEVVLADGRAAARSVLAGDDATSLGRLGPLPAGWTVEWVEVDDEPANTWRRYVDVVEIGDSVVLRPAWLPALDDGRIEIEIEPGGSFGLGDHPTTRLTAAAVVRLARPGQSVLDVGCGSGVLGIVAARLGATAVTGVDIADAAVEATIDNALRNGVEIDASTAPVGGVAGPYDLVLANLLAPTIIELAEHLRRLVGPGGALVISGVLADRHDHVVEALAPLEMVRTDVLDGWAAVELRA